MRGRLATTTGYRRPPLPEGERLKPFPLWGKLKEGTRPMGASEGGAGRSCLFSQREKIEMRGPLATTTGYRRPPLPEGERLKPFPLWGKLKEGTRPKGASEGWGREVLPLLPTGED